MRSHRHLFLVHLVQRKIHIDEPIASSLRSAPRALGGLGDPRRSPYSPLPYSFTLSLAPTIPVALCLYPAEVSPSFNGTARSYPRAGRRP